MGFFPSGATALGFPLVAMGLGLLIPKKVCLILFFGQGPAKHYKILFFVILENSHWRNCIRVIKQGYVYSKHNVILYYFTS